MEAELMNCLSKLKKNKLSQEKNLESLRQEALGKSALLFYQVMYLAC